MNVKFWTHILSIDRNKSPLQISGKVAGCVVRTLETFQALIYWAHRAVFFAIAQLSCFAVGSKRRIFVAIECIIDRSRSSKVDDFGTNRKCICDSLLRRHSILGHILHRFWHTATYWLRILRIFATRLSFGAPALYVFFGISW